MLIELLTAIAWFILLAIMSLPLLRYISELLTSIGIYHNKDETIWERCFCLYRIYLFVSVPTIFIIYTLISTSGLIDNPFDAGLISIASYSLFPISIRVLALAEKPIQVRDIQRIDWVKFGNLNAEKFEDFCKNEGLIDIIGKFGGEETATKFRQFCEDEGVIKKIGAFVGQEASISMKRSLLHEKKERLISSVFSMIFVGWMLHITILFVNKMINGDRIVYIPGLEMEGAEFIGLLALIFILPIIYVIIGETILHICKVDELMKAPPKKYM